MAYQGTSPQIGTHKKLDNLTFNGVTTSFVLSASGAPVFPAIAEALLISLNGVLQEPNGSFTVSGSNITFSSAPAIGTSFFGVLLGEKVLLADVVAASGGTMTGLLTLSANPTAAMHASTKQYVDSSVATKQNTLVSGTSIKTLNGASILGSGDITAWTSTNDGAGSGLDADMLDGQHAAAFQLALVSGTTIKTINGVSVLGSGDIVISTSGGGEAFSAF
jgi:hypothetical protein